MINFNFLGLGSFSAAQQKGKSTGVKNVDPENNSILLDGDSPVDEAAFPDVLMQILLGQQLPVAIPGKTEQTPILSETTIDGEVLVPNNHLYPEGQPVSLREQLFAGEMKKQLIIQKTELQKPISNESKITLDQSESADISKILSEGLVVAETEISTPEVQKEDTGEIQLLSDANTAKEGMNINSSQLQPILNQLTMSTPQEMQYENSNTVMTNSQTKSKQINNKSTSQVNNLFMNEIVQSDADNAMTVPIEKQAMQSKEFQTKAIANEGLSKRENKPVGEELNSVSNAKSSKNPLINNEIKMRSVSFGSKKPNATTFSKEQNLVSITSNDFQQHGILSAVVTQNSKPLKNNNNESTVIDKSNSSEKQTVVTTTLDIDKSLNTSKSESQNTGNHSSMQKENFEHQQSVEKNAASVDVRQGFASVVEEKNIVSVSKTHQADVTSLLRQQDAVNNIFEQLAKNVKISLDENNSQIKISLKPEALGDVMLKVTIEHGKVSTQMEVQQPQVKTVIEANLQMLRESLSSKGLVVDRIDISTAQYSLNEKSSQQGQQRPTAKNYFGKEIAEEETEQTKLYGYNTVDYVA